MSKIRKIKNVDIYNDEYVLKNENDLSDLYDFFKSRGFENYLPILERVNSKNKYKFIKDINYTKYTKGVDIIDVMSLLHNKTSFNKEVGEEKLKEIYDNISGYNNYLNDYYESLVSEIEFYEFLSPSDQILLNNYSKILSVFSFIDSEIKNWYKLIKDKNNIRVSLIHGDLRLEHLINNDKKYLISWKNNNFDTPIIDFVNFYHNEWENLEFSSLLKRYLEKCKLNNEELKLLFINLAFPLKYERCDNEFLNVCNIREIVDYIYKTEELIRPYYSIENKE